MSAVRSCCWCCAQRQSVQAVIVCFLLPVLYHLHVQQPDGGSDVTTNLGTKAALCCYCKTMATVLGISRAWHVFCVQPVKQQRRTRCVTQPSRQQPTNPTGTADRLQQRHNIATAAQELSCTTHAPQQHTYTQHASSTQTTTPKVPTLLLALNKYLPPQPATAIRPQQRHYYM